VVAQWLGDVVAKWLGDVVAQWLGDVISQWFGDVVAQWLSPLAETRLSRSTPAFDPGFPHSLLRGGRNHDCVR
jgi:pantoate kinase